MCEEILIVIVIQISVVIKINIKIQIIRDTPPIDQTSQEVVEILINQTVTNSMTKEIRVYSTLNLCLNHQDK